MLLVLFLSFQRALKLMVNVYPSLIPLLNSHEFFFWVEDLLCQCSTIFCNIVIRGCLIAEYWPAGKTVITSDHALKLESVPDWIAIVGSGYIGLEFSDVYTALGSEVAHFFTSFNGCCNSINMKWSQIFIYFQGKQRKKALCCPVYF